MNQGEGVYLSQYEISCRTHLCWPVSDQYVWYFWASEEVSLTLWSFGDVRERMQDGKLFVWSWQVTLRRGPTFGWWRVTTKTWRQLVPKHKIKHFSCWLWRRNAVSLLHSRCCVSVRTLVRFTRDIWPFLSGVNNVIGPRPCAHLPSFLAVSFSCDALWLSQTWAIRAVCF